MQECASASTGLGRRCRTFSSLKSPKLMSPDGAEEELWVSAGAGWGVPLASPSILIPFWGSSTCTPQHTDRDQRKQFPTLRTRNSPFTAFLVIKRPKIK